MTDEKEKSWALDRHIPIAAILVVVLQTGAWIWWAASFSSVTEKRLDYQERRMDSMELLPERLASLEAQSRAQTDVLREIREDLRGRK